ncbi:M3 family metallopeptidase [Luteibacter rhizovicinus]|nr:M3 family metallopeptidase [Luteibacter rhizovicinus]
MATANAETHSIDQHAYFASPEAEQSDRKALLADMAAVVSPTSPTPRELLDYLHRSEALLARAQRHNAWLHLRSALDIDDRETADAKSAMGSADGQLVMQVRTTLRSLGKEGFDKAVAREPALGTYAYLLERAVRSLPHELPDAQQSILDSLSDASSSDYWNIYQKTKRSTDFGKIATASGERDINKDADALLRDPDRSVRQQAWTRRWDAYANRGDIYASILLGVVRLNDRAARLQHFDDAPAAAYFSRQFDRKNVDETTKAVEAQADTLKNYQRIRAEHIGAMTGIVDVHSWDMALPPPGFVAPAFTYENMRSSVLRALRPLGPDYVAHFAALLDPVANRTDLAEKQGTRVSDAFSIAAPGVPAGLFVGTYEGAVKDASVVAHEGGHAIHAQLMNEHGVSPFFNHGPSWMHEGIAILNEMLFYEDLYRNSKDPATRAFYLQSQLDEMTFEIFTSAEEGELEQAIYDGTVGGTIKNAADLDALTLSTISRFEIWPARDPQLAHAWMTKRLMYQDPLYLVNYLYAGLLATKMFDMATRDPADFQKRYARLLAEGFAAKPDDILRRFFGRDLPPGELVAADMEVIRRKTAELAILYKKIEQKQ